MGKSPHTSDDSLRIIARLIAQRLAADSKTSPSSDGPPQNGAGSVIAPDQMPDDRPRQSI